jgi:hypothetical protein
VLECAHEFVRRTIEARMIEKRKCWFDSLRVNKLGINAEKFAFDLLVSYTVFSKPLIQLLNRVLGCLSDLRFLHLVGLKSSCKPINDLE